MNLIKKIVASITMLTILIPVPTFANNVDTKQQFIDGIAKDAQQIAYDNNLYASVMIAQAALESNYGTSGLYINDYNLFGIKGYYRNKATKYYTKEQDANGNEYTITSYFRKYPSSQESLQDYVNLLKTYNNGYYHIVFKDNSKTYQQATKNLTNRYATDKKYNEKLNYIIQTYNLTQYDKKPPETIMVTKIGNKIEPSQIDEKQIIPLVLTNDDFISNI